MIALLLNLPALYWAGIIFGGLVLLGCIAILAELGEVGREIDDEEGDKQ